MNLSPEELLSLLRDASLRPESIAEEIEVAGGKAPPADQLARARDLLAACAALPEGAAEPDAAGSKATAAALAGLPETLADLVLRAAGQAGRQDVLREVALTGPKPLAKEAKRELQRLKQKGVRVAELLPQGAPVVKAAPAETEPTCHATSVDAWGERAVWVTKNARGGGVELVQVVLSDVKGILAVDALLLPRRSFRDFVRKMPRGGVVGTAEVPRPWARWIIQQAAEAGARNGFSPPQTYGQALSVLGPAPESEPPHPAADLDFGPDGELPHQLAGAALFADPLFVAWIPDEEALRAWGKRFDELAGSALFADEAQKQAAIDQAAREAADAWFDEAKRALYAHRLREMAIVLRAEGRIDAARTALATSRALAGKGGSAQPFCTALFAHAMEKRATPAARPASESVA